MVKRILPKLMALVAVAQMTAAPASPQDWAGRGRLQGVVKNEQGSPLEGAKVSLRQDGQEGQGPEPLLTDKRGKWAYLGLAAGQWSVFIEYEGYVPSEGSVEVSQFGPGQTLGVVLRPIPEEELAKSAAAEALARIEEGNALLEQGDYVAARRAYTEALAGFEQESHPSILTGIARTYYKQGDSEQAIDTLEKALELAPDDEDSLRLIISLLVATDREEEAQTYMERLPEGSSIDPDALLNLGIKAYNDNDLETALGYFDRAVAENLDVADAYYYRGLCLLNMSRNEEAEADFRRLLELAPDHPRAEEVRQFLEYIASER
jgi:tetratricopeptide (TPR) repeat protein